MRPTSFIDAVIDASTRFPVYLHVVSTKDIRGQTYNELLSDSASQRHFPACRITRSMLSLWTLRGTSRGFSMRLGRLQGPEGSLTLQEGIENPRFMLLEAPLYLARRSPWLHIVTRFGMRLARNTKPT